MHSVSRALSLTEQATESIKNSILAGDLVPGRLYTATELGEQLNVSRTPIREALQELARRGLVSIEKNRGVRVLNTSVESLVEVFQVRLMIEVPLSRRATAQQTEATIKEVEDAFASFRRAAEGGHPGEVLRADRDFHRALMAGARNERAGILLQEQRDFVLTTGVGTVPRSRSAMECFADHVDIMDAFRDGDSEAVGTAVARHIAHTARTLIRQELRDESVDRIHAAEAAIDWLVH